jgi:hypothetical protein
MSHPFSEIALKNIERIHKLDNIDQNFQAVRYRIDTKDSERFELYEATEQVDDIEVADILYDWKCHKHVFLEIPQVLIPY